MSNISDFIDINNFKDVLVKIQNDNNSNIIFENNINSNSLTRASSFTLDENDVCFEVDANTRKITIPAEHKNIGVYNDHNAQKIYLRVNRYFDDVDLITKTCVVLFINPEGVESYSLTNVYIDSTDNEKIIVEWTITFEHTASSGTLTFALCFYHFDNNNNLFDYRWSTIPVSGNILFGLDLVKGSFENTGYDDWTILISMVEQETEDRTAADNELNSKISLKADKTSLDSKADKSYNSGFIGGTGAKLNAVGGTAIGQNAQASSGVALGNSAQASEGVGAGKNAYASHGAALGRDTKTLHGVAAGDGAQTVDEDGNPITAIQLGKGTNTEPNTAKFFDYTIMDADGTVPRERIPDAVNRYDVSALPSKLQTYDFSDGVSKFIAVERMDVAVESETQVMMSAANAGNKYGLAQFDFGSITDGATRIIAEYDTKYDGGRWEISLVDMSKRPGTSDKSSYDTAGVAFRTGTRDANNNFYLNGDNKYDTTLNNVWVHIRADIDLTAGTLKYEVSAEGALKYSGEIAVPESVGTIDGLEIYTWAQGTIYADNIKINALYDVDENGLYVTDEAQYIYKDGEPVALGADMNDYYTKSYLDDKFSGYDTQIMMMNESIMGKAELYEFNQLNTKVDTRTNYKAATTPVKIGVWNDGSGDIPIWRVVYSGTITYDENNPTLYEDKTFFPFTDYENNGAKIYANSYTDIIYVNGYIDLAFQDDSFISWQRGIRIEEILFDFPESINNSEYFTNHVPILYRGYLDFATPESNIK